MARISAFLCVFAVLGCRGAEPARGGPTTSGAATDPTTGGLASRSSSAATSAPYVVSNEEESSDERVPTLRHAVHASEVHASESPPSAPADGPEPSGSEEHHGVGRALMSARCDREERCGNVGEDHDYADRAACLAGSVDAWSSSLDCPDGIDRDRLRACLAAIRAQDCRTTLDSLDRIAACRTAHVCGD